jgi:hypothetical protein
VLVRCDLAKPDHGDFENHMLDPSS